MRCDRPRHLERRFELEVVRSTRRAFGRHQCGGGEGVAVVEWAARYRRYVLASSFYDESVVVVVVWLLGGVRLECVLPVLCVSIWNGGGMEPLGVLFSCCFAFLSCTPLVYVPLPLSSMVH